MSGAVKQDSKRAWRYPPRSEHPDAVVFVYEDWCKACGICYELCPAAVLTFDKAGCPIVSNPEACKGCYLCEALCPEMAITVYRERGGASGASGDRADAGGGEADGDEAREASSEAGGSDGTPAGGDHG
jgi:2-oxoglutarate ferredoxin oxidoreductase subunit delta